MPRTNVKTNLRLILSGGLLLHLLFCSFHALASGQIYVSKTTRGLTVYSSDPIGTNSRLYLTVTQAPAMQQSGLASSLRGRKNGIHENFDTQALAGIKSLTAAYAKQYSVPQALLLAVIHAESAFNPQARSSAGAIGLMQIMPATGRRYGVHENLTDPTRNIAVGARYLRDLLDMFSENQELALAAYNAGEGAVLKYGRRIPPFAETRAYVPRVLALYQKYQDRTQQ